MIPLSTRREKSTLENKTIETNKQEAREHAATKSASGTDAVWLNRYPTRATNDGRVSVNQ